MRFQADTLFWWLDNDISFKLALELSQQINEMGYNSKLI